MSDHWELVKANSDRAIRNAETGAWSWAVGSLVLAVISARVLRGRERKWARRRIRGAFGKIIGKLSTFCDKVDAELSEEPC